MKRKTILLFLLFLAAVAAGTEAAEVEIPGNLTVSGPATSNSFLCAGSPCLNPQDISSGTAGFDITGNAAYAPTATSVTNGVYATGSYANPSWITSLDGSKITGSITGNAAYAPTATSVTNGVYTTGSYANPSWVTSLSISKIDGIITPVKMGFYDKVAIVATTGGDYADPATAMSSYSAWCGTPSASNTCLLKIMPGVYTVTSPVMMRSFIDIEGSGEKVTKITSALGGTMTPPEVATVMAQNPPSTGDAQIRFLTIENTGTGSYTAAMVNYYGKPSLAHVTMVANGEGGGYRYGIFSEQCLDVPMRDVTVNVTGGANNYGIAVRLSAVTMINVKSTATGRAGSENIGIWIYNTLSPSYLPLLTDVTATASGGQYNYGIYNVEFAKPTMNKVTATASGPANTNIGIVNWNSSPTMTAVTTIASGGTNNFGVQNLYSGGNPVPTVRINHSVIKGTQKSLYNRWLSGALPPTIYAGNTQLDGTVTNETGVPLTCVGAYSGTYTALNNLCK